MSQHVLLAQFPPYFTHNDENKLPSNEIYSLAQDKQGFLWFGCDVGLYKYDGVRYWHFKSNKQKSKSITGLTISSSGKLYCYNFNAQVFVLVNDSLIELHKISTGIITNIAADEFGRIYISHAKGLEIYNERTRLWERKTPIDPNLVSNKDVTKLAKTNPANGVFYLQHKGISFIGSKTKKVFNTSVFEKLTPGYFLPAYHNNNLWIFSAESNLVYKLDNGELVLIKNKNLLNILSNRKITNVKSLPDGKLWICTYKGIICYKTQSDAYELFYPEKSFSDCLIDMEGNYWFGTLQNGLLRIANMDMRVWNSENGFLLNDKISKMANANDDIYFATINGTVGKLNLSTNYLKIIHSKAQGDVQSFDYDEKTKILWFNINNILYKVKNDEVQRKELSALALKTLKQIGNQFFYGSSHGLTIDKQRVLNGWIRDIIHDEKNNSVWVASNDGLNKLKQTNLGWQLSDTILKETQIISMDFDDETELLYAITFEGNLYEVSRQGKPKLISNLPNQVQAYKLKLKKKNLFYFATNKGLWIYNQNENSWNSLNILSGLASNNIQSLCFANETLCLATGRGLQIVPTKISEQNKTAKLFIKHVQVGNTKLYGLKNIELNHGEALLIYPEALTYKSNSDFYYAYRIICSDTSWIKLPAEVDGIEIQNIPSGDFEIELKVIDHFGLDSVNIVSITGKVLPPFWKRTWFMALISLLVLAVLLVFFKFRILQIQKEQQKEIERITLENELRLSRETALKSQMNPHFVFNVLNSIKAFIYKNDKQKASAYLNDFSDLIRTFLNMSNSSFTTLADELKMLKLYIGLEAMLLNDDFAYTQTIDDDIDLEQTKIPTLIVQPFIENAFKHGLHHKQGSKQLTFAISKNNSGIILEISDNGIGRAASHELQKNKTLNHQSFATSAIEKRIELLNKNSQLVVVTTIDLLENEKPTGTKINITIQSRD